MRACLAALLLLTTGSPALPQALTDCNNNGIPDDQDIGGGTSADANANGVPDECEPCGLTEDAKLVGLSGGERAGFAVALDNGVALMGSPNADVAATDAGSVRVLRRVGGQWRTEASLTAPDAAALDHFGTSVAIQSDLALVGAPDDDDTGSNSGSAYVFRFDGAAWALETKLRPGPSSAGARFGRCVALAGNRAFVGAPEANSLSGAVHVFEFDGAAWSQVARLVAPGTAAGDQFGRSVAATEDLLLVGAPLHDLPAGNAGAAYVYRLV